MYIYIYIYTWLETTTSLHSGSLNEDFIGRHTVSNTVTHTQTLPDWTDTQNRKHIAQLTVSFQIVCLLLLYILASSMVISGQADLLQSAVMVTL